MRKLMTLMLGLSLAVGAVSFAFAQEKEGTKKESKKKKGKKQKEEKKQS